MISFDAKEILDSYRLRPEAPQYRDMAQDEWSRAVLAAAENPWVAELLGAIERIKSEAIESDLGSAESRLGAARTASAILKKSTNDLANARMVLGSQGD